MLRTVVRPNRPYIWQGCLQRHSSGGEMFLALEFAVPYVVVFLAGTVFGFSMPRTSEGKEDN